MTKLHNTNNNNNHTYSSSSTPSFDWFDRSNQQQQLPPIHFSSSSTDMTTTATTDNPQEQGFHNNSMMDEDIVSRRSQQQQQQQHYGASSSSSSGWMSNSHPANTTTTTSTGYSPTRDSCDLSYEGEDYHHHHGQPTPSPSASTERSRSKKHRTPSTRDIHVEKNTEGKPPYSYATLIKYAIENSLRKKLTLSEIYQWVIDHYPYYGSAGTGWKNSIRHNLSLNKSFVRVPRPINEPGKGSYWQVDYRAAEAEMRSKSNLAVRGRASRSGSDPYRPDSSWASLNNNNNNNNSQNNFNPRFNRDSRSLSMDSNMNTKAAHFSASSSSSSSSSAAAAAAAVAAAAANMNGGQPHYNSNNGYYSHHQQGGYGYNNTTRHNSLNNRHSADYSRSSYMGYDMYTAPVDNTATPNTIPHHYTHHHNRMQQVPMYDNNNNHTTTNHPSPYGQPMYSPGYPQGYSHSHSLLNDKEEDQQQQQQQPSFSTPQPHYRRVTSPSLTAIKHEKPTNSPSPPQPSMDTSSKRGKSLNSTGNEDYNWIA